MGEALASLEAEITGLDTNGGRIHNLALKSSILGNLGAKL